MFLRLEQRHILRRTKTDLDLAEICSGLFVKDAFRLKRALEYSKKSAQSLKVSD